VVLDPTFVLDLDPYFKKGNKNIFLPNIFELAMQTYTNKNKNKNKNIYLSFLAIHAALMITANMFELYDVIVWALMDANST
jgi:hypothetical protein